MVLNNILTLEVLSLLATISQASLLELGTPGHSYLDHQHIHLDTTSHSHTHEHYSNTSRSHIYGSHNPTTLVLPGHHKFDPFQHFQQSCPKPSPELIEWPVGKGKLWTETPLCTRTPNSTESTEKITKDSKTQDAFCVFTSQKFLGGRGISVATKPHIAAEIGALPAFGLENGPRLHQDLPPPFEIKYVVGKGMGVIANRTIYRGERLFAHGVIGIFHNDVFLTRRSKEYGLRTNLMETGVEQLPREARENFHAMIGQSGTKNQVIGKLNVNTFGETFGGEEHSIIIPETARMNHDCRPNAMYYFDPQTLIHYTQAARTINAGEEVTITYIDPLQSREDRQAAIELSWGFKCTCTLCTQPPAYTDASDGRIAAINQLVKILLGEKNKKGEKILKEENKPQMTELLVDLYAQERLDSHIVDAWMWAAMAYKEAGRFWEALKWTYRAEEGVLIHEGPRNEGSIRMANLIEELGLEVGLEEAEES